MMSMKTEEKPVSFVEDCAVKLENLAEYTNGLKNIFKKYGVNGTWYAHASVGCLHVRPVLNMKLSKDAKARIKRMSNAERKAVHKAATLLADNDIITHDRWMAVSRIISSSTRTI